MAKAKLLVILIHMLSLALLMFSVRAQFDYFQMVQQWPPATCSKTGVRCRGQPPTMFTIHGLWPNNYSGVHLVCTGLPFNPTQIATLRTQLDTFWPDVIQGNQQRFWQYEWNKHGTCSDPPFNQFQYFQTTLNMRMNPNYDLWNILNNAGLPPTGRLTQYNVIEHAIEVGIGKKPGLRCNINGRTGRLQLSEITLCFDKDGVTLIDCTNSASSNCHQPFVWLHRQPLSLVDAVGEVKDSLVYGSSIPKSLFLFSIPLSIAFMFRKKFYQTPTGVRSDEKQE